MSNYSKGANYERAVKKELEKEGYSVIRSAGSHGIFDLVAWKSDKILFIQVKYLCKATKADIEKLNQIIIPINGRKILWEKQDKNTVIKYEITRDKCQAITL